MTSLELAQNVTINKYSTKTYGVPEIYQVPRTSFSFVNRRLQKISSPTFMNTASLVLVCLFRQSSTTEQRYNSIPSEITIALRTHYIVPSWAACILRVLIVSYRNYFVQDNDIISRHLEKAAQLTVGALMDVPSVFSGQTFDANT